MTDSMKYKLSTAFRLTTSEQFKNVFLKARKKSFGLYRVFFCHNKLDYPRLGVIAPKKSIKQATKRNFFKRRVRESFRLQQHQLESLDIVFIAYKNAATASKEELWEHLDKTWRNLIRL